MGSGKTNNMADIHDKINNTDGVTSIITLNSHLQEQTVTALKTYFKDQNRTEIIESGKNAVRDSILALKQGKRPIVIHHDLYSINGKPNKNHRLFVKLLSKFRGKALVLIDEIDSCLT